ncbi:hypothetical protein ACET3Z_005010 [Daucus carota]
MERMMTEDKGGNDVVIDAQRRCEHDENILAEVNELNMDLSENNLIVEDSLHMDEENFDGGSGENEGIDDGNSYENKNKGGNDVIIDANGDCEHDKNIWANGRVKELLKKLRMVYCHKTLTWNENKTHELIIMKNVAEYIKGKKLVT